MDGVVGCLQVFLCREILQVPDKNKKDKEKKL